MMYIRDRLRATDYYTNLDESSSPSPSKKLLRIKQLNEILEGRLAATFGFSTSSAKTSACNANTSELSPRIYSKDDIRYDTPASESSCASERSDHRKYSDEDRKKSSDEDRRKVSNDNSRKSSGGTHRRTVSDSSVVSSKSSSSRSSSKSSRSSQPPPSAPKPNRRTYESTANITDSPNKNRRDRSKSSSSAVQLRNRDSSSPRKRPSSDSQIRPTDKPTKTRSTLNLNIAKDNARHQLSRSQINLRPRNDNSPCSLLPRGADPEQYRHIRWNELEDIIYEHDHDEGIDTSHHRNHVSRNKSFHTSRNTDNLNANRTKNPTDFPIVSENVKLKCQSVDNLNNIKNNNLYINHIHREVINNFINKNHISHINSNLFQPALPNDEKNTAVKIRRKHRSTSRSKKCDDIEKNDNTKSSHHRHHSTSDYASHSDSSSSSSSYSCFSGSQGGYSSPMSSTPSSPVSSFTDSFASSSIHSSSCPAFRSSSSSSSPGSPPPQPRFGPKLLHVSSGKDRWVVRRPDGLVVEILPEIVWIKEQRKRTWKKAMLEFFKEKYVKCELL